MSSRAPDPQAERERRRVPERRAAQTIIRWEFATAANEMQRQIFQYSNGPKWVMIQGSNLQLEPVSPAESIQPNCFECRSKHPEETADGFVETLTHYKECTSGVVARNKVLFEGPKWPDVAILTSDGLDISGHCMMCSEDAHCFSSIEPRHVYCSPECQLAHLISVNAGQ